MEVPESEVASVRIESRAPHLLLQVDAPYHGDPAPPGAPGSTPGLWDFEVVELFLLGRHNRYLEIELGPHGHYLVLELHGRRNPAATQNVLEFRATRPEQAGGRWRGEARVPLAWLPPGMDRANAYAIHGVGAARCYLAWQPVPGDVPDFHRLEHFAPIAIGDHA